MAEIQIEGKVAYQDLGTGFWGIIANDGSKWRPVNMPASLQKEGLSVSIKAEEQKEAFSIFMWGKSIKIISY